jgi:hypothetical protein
MNQRIRDRDCPTQGISVFCCLRGLPLRDPHGRPILRSAPGPGGQAVPPFLPHFFYP